MGRTAAGRSGWGGGTDGAAELSNRRDAMTISLYDMREGHTDTLASVLRAKRMRRAKQKQNKNKTKRIYTNDARKSSTNGCVGVRGCSYTASSQSGTEGDERT